MKPARKSSVRNFEQSVYVYLQLLPLVWQELEIDVCHGYPHHLAVLRV